MKLKWKAPDLAKMTGIKHFNWSDIAKFAAVDRYPASYGSDGSGDWKSAKDGADGFFLVTVGGDPYWNDAVVQIPFAVDTGSAQDYKIMATLERRWKRPFATGQAHAGGSVIPGVEVDRTNNYDNYWILRGAIWASERCKVSGSGCFIIT